MSRTRYRVFDNNFPHFLTCSIVGWLPVFTRPAAVDIVFDSWRYLTEHKRLTIFGYVIMENHLHLIASSPNLGKEIGDFKSFTARRIIDHLRACGDRLILDQLSWCKDKHKEDREFQLWQEGSHPQQIQGEQTMLQKLEYIHNNPVKRGYVAQPEHWLRSSASNYAGLESLFPVVTDW
jgi:putative transposase